MWQEMNSGYTLIKRGNQILGSTWGNEVLFSWRWWLVLSLSVVPWVAVYVYLGRQKRNQYVIASLLALTISSILDIAGLTYDLWRYSVTVLPIMGGFFPWDFSVLPVFFIMAYELFPTWYPFWKGLIVAFAFAFIGEPITEYLGLTNHLQWEHLYSFPIYYLIFLVSYYGSKYLSKRSETTTSENEISVLERSKDKYLYVFKNSFDSIHIIEKKHWEKDFRFTEVNDTFCEEMGYTREEIMQLDPRAISDQEKYNVDIKYRPLVTKGSMKLDTTFVTKTGEKKYVSLNVKVFWRKEKIEILSIAKFLENKVVEEKVT